MSAIKCIKYLLFSFNVVFWLAGMGTLGVGIWMYIDPGKFNEFMGSYSFKIPAAILMAAGSIVMLTGFCGCLGAIKEVRCLLGSFFFMLLLIFCAEVACGVLGFLFKDKIETEIQKETLSLIQNKYGNQNIDITHVIDTTQQQFECCGANSPNDYEKSNWRTSNSYIPTSVPISCCKSGKCTGASVVSSNIFAFKKGCVTQIKDYALKHLLIIGGVAIGVGCIQLIGMVLALCLFFSIDNY